MDGFLARRRLDERIAAIADGQWGVVTRDQLRGIGISGTAIEARARAGRLHRLHRGVYAVGHHVLRDEGHWLAAVLAVGPAAVLSHGAAAALWGLLPVPAAGPVDVSVPSAGGRARRAGLRIHRCAALTADEATHHRRIPVTTPARTLADLRAVLPAWRFHRAVNQAEVDGLLSPEDLAALFPGVADGTRSDLERRFVNICRRHGVKPLPETNVLVGGRLVDAYFRGDDLVVEIDSARYHRTETGFHRDRRRGNDIVVAGRRLLRFTDLQLTHEPGWVADTVRRARIARRPGDQPNL